MRVWSLFCTRFTDVGLPLDVGQLLSGEIRARRTMPLFTLVASNKFAFVLLVAVHTDVLLLFLRRIHFLEAFVAKALSIGPARLCNLLLSCNWSYLFLADSAFDTALAIPVFSWYLSKFRLKAEDMDCLVAHLAKNQFVFLGSSSALLAGLAVGAVPLKAVHDFWQQWRLVTLAMHLLATLLALEQIRLNHGQLADKAPVLEQLLQLARFLLRVFILCWVKERSKVFVF